MDDINVIIGQAENLFIEEQYEYSIYLFSSVIDQKHSNNKVLADIYVKRGTSYTKINKFTEAIEDFETAINLDANNLLAYKKLSNCFLTMGQTKKAKEILTKSLHLEENKDRIITEKNLLGNMEIKEKIIRDVFKSGDYERTINLIDDLIKQLEVPDACVWHKILKAKSLIYLKKFEESLKIINDILFINKENHEAIYVRGLNFIYQQKYKLGLEDLREVINDCPDAKNLYEKYKNIEKLLSNASTLKNTNIQEAQNIYKQILNIDPQNNLQNQTICFELAKISYQEKNYTDAILYSTEILISDKTNLNALKLRALASVKNRDYEDTIEDYIEINKLENNERNKSRLRGAYILRDKDKIDNYKRLGINNGASLSEITKAFRKLSKEYHPDKNMGSAAEQFIAMRKFRRIQEAYNQLKSVI